MIAISHLKNIVIPFRLVIFVCSILEVSLFPQGIFSDYRQHPELLQQNNDLNGKVSVDTTNWSIEKLNPKIPQIHYLCTHFVSKDTGWATGQNGVILKTTNGGTDWKGCSTPTTQLLTNLNSFNKQIHVAVGFGGTILRSTDYGETWAAIQSASATASDLWRVTMIDDSTGFISGKNGVLLKTTNAGTSFQQVSTGLPPDDYWYVAFYKRKYGFLGGNNGMLYRTTDAGSTWRQMNVGKTFAIYTITILDTQNIVVGGSGGWIASTSNAGISWKFTQVQPPVVSMAFSNDSTGYTHGYGNRLFYWTVDRGFTWTTLWNKYPVQLGENWIEFLDDSTGVMAGNNLRLLKTTDGGRSWDYMLPLIENIRAVSFVSEKAGFCADNNYLFFTSDGGHSWARRKEISGITALVFIDTLNGLIGRSSTEIQRSTDGGQTWLKKNISGLSDSLSSNTIDRFHAVTGNEIYAVSTFGIYRSTDGGNNWQEVSSQNGETFFYLSSQAIYRTSDSLLRSSDGCVTWKKLSKLSSGNNDDLYFLDSLTGFYTQLNKLFGTTDGGISWTLLLTNSSTSTFFTMCWFDKKHGFLAGNVCYETWDSGRTWAEVSVLQNRGTDNMHRINDNLGVGAGTQGLLYKYFKSTFSRISDISPPIESSLDIWAYPNPANNENIILFRSPVAGTGALRIFTVHGEKVYEDTGMAVQPNSIHKYHLNAARLSSGCYFVTVQINTLVKCVKLIVIK